MSEQTKLDPTLASLLRHMRDDIEWTLDGVVSPRQGLDRIQMGLRAACEVLNPTPRLEPKQKETAKRDASVWASDCKVVCWAEENKITLDKVSVWRFVKGEPRGTIQGLDEKRIHGHACITNGVLVWIKLGKGGLFQGHWENFIPDEKPKAASNGGRKGKSPKDESEKQRIKEELLAMLKDV